MPAIALHVLALLAPLGSHLASYAELGAAVAEEYRAAWVRRLVWAAVALLAGVAGLATAWLAGLIALWETPWRLTYVVVSAAVLLLVAGIGAALALAVPRRGHATGLLREEFRRDRELLATWTRTL